MPYAIANGIEEEKMVGSKMFFTILDDEIDGVKMCKIMARRLILLLRFWAI